MTGPFILLAVALTAIAVGLIVIPLVRDGAAPRAPWAALAGSAVLAIGAATLYAYLSNWSWRPPAPPATPQEMVSQLARRLAQHPDDLQGWLMLGRSYTVLEEFALAARAYQHADRLAAGKNIDALTGLGEALVLQSETALDERAGRLFEQALSLDPHSGKALFYTAAAALRRGDLTLARTRFATLLSLDPPASVKPILQAQIDAIDAKLAKSSPPR